MGVKHVKSSKLTFTFLVLRPTCLGDPALQPCGNISKNGLDPLCFVQGHLGRRSVRSVSLREGQRSLTGPP